MESKRKPKSQQVMFRATERLARAIRRAAAAERRSVADWVRVTLEEALANRTQRADSSAIKQATWRAQVEGLSAEGWLIGGTQRKSPKLLGPPPGPGPAGVLDALLEERREGR